MWLNAALTSENCQEPWNAGFHPFRTRRPERLHDHRPAPQLPSLSPGAGCQYLGAEPQHAQPRGAARGEAAQPYQPFGGADRCRQRAGGQAGGWFPGDRRGARRARCLSHLAGGPAAPERAARCLAAAAGAGPQALHRGVSGPATGTFGGGPHGRHRRRRLRRRHPLRRHGAPGHGRGAIDRGAALGGGRVARLPGAPRRAPAAGRPVAARLHPHAPGRQLVLQMGTGRRRADGRGRRARPFQRQRKQYGGRRGPGRRWPGLLPGSGNRRGAA